MRFNKTAGNKKSGYKNILSTSVSKTNIKIMMNQPTNVIDFRRSLLGKVFFKMKFSILLLLTTIQLSAINYGQNLINLNERNVEIDLILKKIEKQTDYRFFYSNDLVSVNKPVSISVERAALPAVLDRILVPTGISWKLMGKNRVVLNNRVLPKELPEIIIQGQVKNSDGEPLNGANIKVQNSNLGTITNATGEFRLNIPGGAAVLEVSYTGYQTKIINVAANDNNINIVLDLANNVLDETVVVAYGTTSKRLNTGSVSSITEKVLEAQPVGDPLAAMQGRISGLMITASNGMPGSNYQVRIRGENSMKQGNEPLYIIDGVPFSSTPLNQFAGANGEQSPLSSINPADIERIDVLKDADATAIYGSRGANGVILIKTKKGSGSGTKVSLNYYTGVSKIARKMPMLNTAQYLQMRKDAFAMDSVTPTAANAPDLLEWDQNKYTDWQDLLIGNNARLSEAQLSFRGGNNYTKYLLSGTYRKEESVLKGDGYYKKGGALAGIDHNSENGKFGVSATFNFTSDFNNSFPTDVSQYFYFAPNFPVYNADGSLYYFGTGENPLAYLNRTYESRTNSILGNSVIRYNILPDLTARVNLGMTQATMEQLQMLPAAGFNPATFTGSTSQFGNSSARSYIVEPQLEYKSMLGGGVLNFLLGTSFQELKRKGNYVLASGFASDALLRNIGSAGTITPRSANSSIYHYTSLFGRLNYQLHNKYLFNGTFRRDGSSRFGPGNRFGNFGAIGLGWIFNKESFIQDALPFLSYGKIRTSYGTTGNDQIGDYQYLDTWSSSSFPYDGSGGLTPTRVYNPNYSWETNRKFEVGLELGFFNDRLLLTSGYYNNTSSNQLIGYTLSGQSGFTSYTANMPAKIQNSGLEFELNTQNIKGANFTWNTLFNISFQKNKLLEYKDLASSGDASAYEVGKSIRIIKGFHFLGIDPNTGTSQFLDVDKNNSISTPNDYVIIGETLPKFFGGLTNELTFKNITLDIFFQFVKQGAINSDYGPLVGNFGSMNNKRIEYLDYWRQAGDQTSIPRPSQSTSKGAYSAYSNYWRYSDAAWEDASYLRLKNVKLAYNFTNLFKSRIGGTVFVMGQNLLTFTKYTGMDPEINGFDRRFVYPVNPFGSVKTQALPVLRTVTAGFNVSI